MAGETTSYEVKCACGAATIVEAAAAGVEQSCASCGASFRVIWALDPATKAKVLRRAAAIRIPPGAFEFSCECGQPLVARRERHDESFARPDLLGRAVGEDQAGVDDREHADVAGYQDQVDFHERGSPLCPAVLIVIFRSLNHVLVRKS